MDNRLSDQVWVFVQSGFVGSLFDLSSIRAGLGVGNVLSDRRIGQMRSLIHQHHFTPQVIQAQVAEIHPSSTKHDRAG